MDKISLNKDYFDAYMGKMSDMVRVINGEGKVCYTNAAYDRNIAGGKPTVGEYCFVVRGRDTACATCPVRDVLSCGSPRQMTRKMGDNSYTVNISPITDETGVPVAVLELYRDMTLDFNIKQNLMEQNSKMRNDLALARSVQQALVGNVMPKVSGYSLYSGFFPCEAVGGDIFDCLISGDKMVFYIADVSGHGVMPAMLGMFFSRGVKTAFSKGIMRPSEILGYVQEEFESLQISDSLYITAFAVVLDIKTGGFLYSNAGLSVAPLLLNDDISELQINSLPISKWFGRPEFKDGADELLPGGRILIYSDGINDIHSDAGAKDALFALFKKTPFDSAEFVRAVNLNLRTRPDDDLTLLLCCRDK